MKRELGVGETLSEAFAIYRDQAGVLLPVAFWLFLGVAIVEALTIEILALFWVGIIVSLTVAILYQGMVVGLVKDVQDGRRDSSVRELMGSVLPVFWPLLGASFLTALGVGGGFLLLVVPGLYLMTIWAVVAPVVVIERRKVTDALGRSRQLVQGSGWAVFGAVLTGFLIGIAAALGFTALATAVVDGEIVDLVFTVLAQTVAAPITALIASVIYFRLLELKQEPASVLEEAGDGLS